MHEKEVDPHFKLDFCEKEKKKYKPWAREVNKKY